MPFLPIVAQFYLWKAQCAIPHRVGESVLLGSVEALAHHFVDHYTGGNRHIE